MLFMCEDEFVHFLLKLSWNIHESFTAKILLVKFSILNNLIKLFEIQYTVIWVQCSGNCHMGRLFQKLFPRC